MLPPMDLSSNPYSTHRHSVIAPKGVVATSQPLAVQAGLKMLEHGGNAVDAAIATAIALTVVEPTSNGIGADAFALVWDGTQLYGLNGSGRAPAGLTLELVRRQQFHDTAAGLAVGDRAGRTRPLARPPRSLRQAAVRHPLRARHPLCRRTAIPSRPSSPADWATALPDLHRAPAAPEFDGLGASLCPRRARATRRREAGAARTTRPPCAASPRRKADDFYKGEIAAGHRRLRRAKPAGVITAADLAAHTSTWVEPISTTYRGYDVLGDPAERPGHRGADRR